MSRDYGWTLREILELTPSEVLLYVDARGPTRFVIASTREAREIATAARERRRAWVEKQLRRDSDATECGDWERLVARSQRSVDEVPDEAEATSGEEHGLEVPTMRDSERLRRIYDELRMIRVAATSEKRAW